MSIRQFLVPLLYLTVLMKVHLTSCLGLHLHLRQHHRSAAFIDLKIQDWDCKHRRAKLFSRKTNDEDEIGETDTPKNSIATTTPLSPDVQLLLDPGLWTSDFLALILASQLIGLLNVINNPEWIQNGGWFQPITKLPSTLDDLVQRVSFLSILWAIASVSVISIAKATSKISIKSNNSDRTDTSAILKRNIQTLAVFGILQIVGSGIVFALGDANGLANNDGFLVEGESAIAWLDALRNCYYVGLSTTGLRFLYGRYFLLS